MTKTPTQAYELIDNMAMHHYSWNVARPKTVASANTESTDSLAEIRAQVQELTTKFDSLQKKNVTFDLKQCGTCGEPHSTRDCPFTSQEEVCVSTGDFEGERYVFKPQIDRKSVV